MVTNLKTGIYSALDPDSCHTRLICLKPGRWSDPIDCLLDQADLDLNPKFEALSYVWGPPTNNQLVYLNCHEVTVTDNLYSALRRLRHLHDSRTLWIDQLSINQDDIDERGQQVGIMNTIYSKAEHVILWLGEEVDQLHLSSSPASFSIPRTRPGSWVLGPFPDNDIGDFCRFKADTILETGVENRDHAPDEPDYIYHAFRLVVSLARMNVHLRDQPYFTQNRDTNESPLFSEEVFRTLDFLMRRPWWIRTWILQECLLPEHATITYGPTSAPLVVFIWASRYYSSHSGTCCADFHRQLPKWQIDILNHFYRIMADIYHPWMSRQRRWKCDLDVMLRLSRNRQATDDRDKVYGLLGLPLKWCDQDPIIPNYRLETPQIYQAATLKIIQMTQTLDVLGDCIHNNDSSYSALPSWVVKWNIPETFRSTGVALYRASADSKAISAHLVSETVLCLSGFKVGTIQQADHAMDFTQNSQRISNVFHSWKNLASNSTPYIPHARASPTDPTPVDDKPSTTLSDHSTSRGWLDAFWRTLCADTMFIPGGPSDSGLAIRRAVPSDRAAFMTWCHEREPTLKLSKAIISEPTVSEDTQIVEPLVGDVSSVVDMTIRNASARQRMFMTDKGYIGLAPLRVKAGDHVFILHGGNAPFLLREVGEAEVEEGVPGRKQYVLLGMCYVHGIMDGEAMKWGFQEDDVYLV